MAYVSESYLWIVITGVLACFCMAFSIGANDVANNFSTSVGSKAIPLWLAICLAAVLETLGATLLGGSVTDAIKTKIIDFNEFSEYPAILMLGMLCALVGAGIWLFLATILGLPVSTTHSIIGAIVGFGLGLGNFHSIKWKNVLFIVISWLLAPISAAILSGFIFSILRKFILRHKTQSFKRSIWVLWFLIFCMSVSFCFFLVFKNPFALQVECLQKLNSGEIESLHPCMLSRWAHANSIIASGISVGMACIIGLILSIIIYKIAFNRVARYRKEMKNKKAQSSFSLDSLEMDESEVKSSNPPDLELKSFCGEYQSEVVTNNVTYSTNESSLNVTVVCGVDNNNNNELNLCMKKAQNDKNKKENDEENQNIFNDKCVKDINYPLSPSTTNKKLFIKKWKGSMQEKWRNMPWFKDLIDEGCEEDYLVHQIHNNAEVFEKETEIFFSACQVLAACLGCIAHSSNDTANAIGPLAAILTIYYKGLHSNCNVDWYVLLFGGLSMSLGLAILGYRVIKTVGIKLIKITPCRGFCIDLAAAWIVLLFSSFGIPLSTTHCAIGSTLGIGLVEKKRERAAGNVSASPFFHYISKINFLNLSSINWKLFASVFLSWIGTVAFSGGVSLILFAFASYSPSITKS